ncbi:hypothetical protein GGR51DRAFT_312607 [Nemania sp. FL0031]|nr:hypothetical protein GGR51DRAFT_312607 [Nemania sp. FL0031]
MAPPNYTFGNAYADDRRHSGSRPGFGPGDRDRDRPPYRRDSRDFRDARHTTDPREARSPHDTRDTRTPREYRRENEPQRPPRIDTSTKAPESSKIVASNSPASAASKPGDGLQLRQIDTTLQKSIVTSSATVDPPTPVIPKAQNPDLQEAFENAYRWGEKCNKRLLLTIRKNRIAQERTQRRLENDKFLAKAVAYPPYSGLADKYDLADRDINDQLKVVEGDYARELEQLVARFTTAKPTTMINNQDSSVADLEAKVEKMSQLLAKQTEQIQSLLEDNKKSRNSITSLETDYMSIKSSYDDLEANYKALKSGHDALESESRSFSDTIQTLQSQQTSMDAENKSFTNQLTDTRTDMAKRFGSVQGQLTEFRNAITDGEKRIISLETTTSDSEGLEEMKEKFDEVKDKLDELDLTTLNELCDAWVTTEYNLKTQHEEYRQRRQNSSSTDDALQSLRQEIDSLRAAHPQPGTGAVLSIQAVEAMVNAKIAAAERAISKKNETYCEGRDNIFGEMIDDVEARTKVLEIGVAKHSVLEGRIQLLEKWKATGSTPIDKNQDINLAERVDRLESLKIGHRVDRIDLAVGDLGRKYEALKGEVSQALRREWVESRLQELGLSNDTKDLQRKIPAIELAIKTLDSQFQNLSTKQLAEHIVRLTNPGFEQRLGKVEAKANQLEGKANGNDKTFNHHRERLDSITAQLRSLVSSEKRVASPSNSDEPSKKRRLEVNGRHPSPLQQQQRNS